MPKITVPKLILFAAVAGLVAIFTIPPADRSTDIYFTPHHAADQIKGLGWKNVQILDRTDLACPAPSVNYNFTATSAGNDISGVVCSGNGKNNLIVIVD